MAQSEQSQRKARRSEDREIEELAPAYSTHKAELDSEVDSLLDEIDDELEVNAEEFVRWAKFAPRGRRGLNPLGFDGGFGSIPLAEFAARANRETFVAIQIETASAARHVFRARFQPASTATRIDLPSRISSRMRSK